VDDNIDFEDLGELLGGDPRASHKQNMNQTFTYLPEVEKNLEFNPRAHPLQQQVRKGVAAKVLT
jgi:hypothetical protein